MTYYITHSGRRIDIENISADDIFIDDIAHHLTKICRYGGALDLDKHYSVAQHSIMLAKYAKREDYSEHIQRLLLMHDATEAYLGDIVNGLKRLLPDYKSIEWDVMNIIYDKYDLYTTTYTDMIVKELDTRILLDECLAFMPHNYYHFTDQMPGIEPLGITLMNEASCDRLPNIIKTSFLMWCNKLNIKD